MGRDKALLPVAGSTLLEYVAAQVREAAGSVTVIGPPERYANLGIAAIPDVIPGCGPLGGILTALTVSRAEWNLIVACDLPCVTAPRLRSLLEAAEQTGADCVAPVHASGLLEPLCAVWRRTCAPAVSRAITQGQRQVAAALAGLSVAPYTVSEPGWLFNLNTPEDWAALQPALTPHE